MTHEVIPQTPGKADHKAPRKPSGFLRTLNDACEPARVRAFALSLVQTAATLGIVLPADLPRVAEAAAIVAGFVLPLIAGESIRKRVSPVSKGD